MWTPCDEPVEEYNEETGKMEIQHHCPYADTYVGYEDEMCRNCCGLGVDEWEKSNLWETQLRITRRNIVETSVMHTEKLARL